MGIEIFKEEISNEILYNFLKLNCKIENNNYILDNDTFKKYEYNNELEEFINNLRNKYKESKKYYIERLINYNNLLTIIRQICKKNDINYSKKIKYYNNNYSINYYIRCEDKIYNN